MSTPLRIALIVGVDAYKDEYYTDLKGAIRDAAKVGGFLEHVLSFKTCLLTNPKADEVVQNLTEICARLDDDSVFMFYFAGHGKAPENSDRQLLFCSNATKWDALGATGVGTISPGVIAQFVREGRGDMFFCFDACRTPAVAENARNRGEGNDGMTNEGTSAFRDVVASIERTRRNGSLANSWTLSSCSDGQPASDGGEFANSLIDAMKVGLASKKEIAFGDEFVQLVEDNLQKNTSGTKQRPVAAGRPFTLATSGAPIIDVTTYSFETPTNATPEPADYKSLMEKMAAMSKELAELKAEKTAPKPKPAVRPVDTWNGTRAGERREIAIKGVKYGFCYCPPGTFMMGSPESEKERYDDEVQHKVTLTRGFWLLETPVTQGLWTAIMDSNPSSFCSDLYSGYSNLAGLDTTDFPVENVSWDDCQDFINELNKLGLANGHKFRLPTESEWEYACRAGRSAPYWWGDKLNGDKANCNGNYPYGTRKKGKYLERTCVVKSYGANPWGLYDMHGNVGEWCSDWYEDYPGGDVVDPVGSIDSDASDRVIRGGGWVDSAWQCRSAARSGEDPMLPDWDTGFRLLLE